MALRARLCNLALSTLFGWFSVAVAQAADSPAADTLPITVGVKSRVVWKGTPVDLSGETVGGQGLNGVTLTFQAPGAQLGSAKSVRASVDIAGRYSAQFTETRAAGLYRVKATAADGEGSAEATFRVTDEATATSDASAAMNGAVKDEAELVAELDADMKRLPPSPAKDQALVKLGELQVAMNQVQQSSPQATAEIQTAIEIGERVPDDKVHARRAELIGAVEALKTHPDARVMLANLHAHRSSCDDLEVVVEGFKFASFLFNLIGSPSGIAANYENDILGYALGKAAQPGGDTAALGASEAAKNARAVTETILDMNRKMKFPGKVLTVFKSMASNSAGIASDLSAFAAGKTMSAYCEQFTGPMKAHMKAQFSEQGVKWWEYEFDLAGTVTVHYPKNATGETIAVKGRMEGNGTNFKVWENELHVLYPELMTSAVIKKIVIPVSVANDTVNSLYASARDVEGSVVGANLPGAFFFEVTGVITKERLELVVGAPRTDMDVSATVIALVVPPLSLAIHPYVYKLPYKNAHFVFERTASTYEIPISTVGKVIRGKRHFENERGGNAAKGFYSVDLEMCNPACGN